MPREEQIVNLFTMHLPLTFFLSGLVPKIPHTCFPACKKPILTWWYV